MADIELIVKIPHSLYANLSKIQRGSIASKRILECVCNGTPLPKGHGRLIDEKVAYRKFYSRCYAKIAKEVFIDVPTIIEADREIRNEKDMFIFN